MRLVRGGMTMTIRKLAAVAGFVLLIPHLSAAQTAPQEPVKKDQEPEIQALVNDLQQALADLKRARTLTEKDQKEAAAKSVAARKVFEQNLLAAINKPDRDRVKEIIDSSRKLGVRIIIRDRNVLVRFPKEFWDITVKH